MRLDSDLTQKLLQEVPRVYHTEINDMLLCALAMTLCEKNSTEKVTIGLEGHGRENISEETDTSRTVGWFTSLFPLLLELKTTDAIQDAIPDAIPGAIPDAIPILSRMPSRMPSSL